MAGVLDQVRRSVKSVAKGMGVTLKNYGREKVTLNYPEEKPTLSERYRGLHGLTIDPETGEENCIGCMACARVCPDNLISMTLEKREGHKGRYPVTFQVDLNPCCFCGLCSEVCPTPYKALIMTHDFELASESRADLVLTKDKLMFYARRDQVQKGHLPEDYQNLSKEQQDDFATLDEAGKEHVAAAVNVQEAVAVVNPVTARLTPKGKVKNIEAERPTQATIAATPAVAATPSTEVAAGPPEPDYSGMDRVARAKAKSAWLRAKKAAEAGVINEPPMAPPAAAETTPLPVAASTAPIEEPVEPDYSGMERVERARAKAAYMKARKAYEAALASGATVSTPDAPATDAATTAEIASAPLPTDSVQSTEPSLAGPPVEPDYSGMDRVERAKAKSAYVKAQKAWEAGNSGAQGAAPGGGGMDALEAKKADAADTEPQERPTLMPERGVTAAAYEALLAASDRTGIAERGSTMDAGMAVEAGGLSPETQRALAEIMDSLHETIK